MKGKKEIKALSDKQMEELESIVWANDRISIFAKKAIIWLLRQSENLTKEINLKFPKKPKRTFKLGREFAHGAHDIYVDLGEKKRKHLGDIIKQMGGSMVLYGYHGPEAGLGASLAFDYYSKGEKELPLMLEEIQAVEL